MTNELKQRDDHEAIRQQRYVARRPQAAPKSSENADLELPALFDKERVEDALASQPAAVPTPAAMTQVQARDISLIEIEDDAVVRTRIFPRSVHCSACGHFFLLSPDRPPDSLTCPCCRRAQLVIEPIVFVCGRCATMRELYPPGERIAPGQRGRKRLKVDERIGASPVCPECGNGHIHLDKHGTNTVSRWEWRCSACAGYVETLQEPCGICGVPAANGNRSDYILMQAIPAAASNALQPLVYEGLFVHDQEIELESLRRYRQEQASRWPDAFSLEDALRAEAIVDDARSTIEASSLRDAYLVDGVRVMTVTYGYKAGSTASHPQTPVDATDRLAQFFRDPEGLSRFLAYSVSTQGAALVLEFDSYQLLQRLSAVNPMFAHSSWDEVATAEMQIIRSSLTRDLLHTDRVDLLAYRTLHAIEHALLTNAIRLTGIEALTSHMFFSAATVMISERTPIGRGGVIQLVNRGPGLIQLLRASRDQVLGCAQGCRDGCPTCIYVRDPVCNQPIEELGAVWLPPNSLLSRRSAGLVLGHGLSG